MRMAKWSVIAWTLLAGAASADTIEMKVNGLVCNLCTQKVDQALRRSPATADVLVSLEHQFVAIATRRGQDIPDSVLRKALTDSGFGVEGISRTQRPLAKIRAELGKAG